MDIIKLLKYTVKAHGLGSSLVLNEESQSSGFFLQMTRLSLNQCQDKNHASTPIKLLYQL